MNDVLIECRVNDEPVSRRVMPRLLLSDFLRHDLGLKGTHVGCEQGVCGACTILLDGRPARSCLMFAYRAGGRSITTIEGLATEGRGGDSPNIVQEEFARRDAFQCGFCSPGFVITATYLTRLACPPCEEKAVREELAGNLCRCTGYASIVDAVIEACARAGSSASMGSHTDE